MQEISTIQWIIWMKCWMGWLCSWLDVIRLHGTNCNQDKKPWNNIPSSFMVSCPPGVGQWPSCTLQSLSAPAHSDLVCPFLAENQAADVKYATVECFLDRGVRLAGEVGSILVGQLTTKATRKVEEPKGWWGPHVTTQEDDLKTSASTCPVNYVYIQYLASQFSLPSHPVTTTARSQSVLSWTCLQTMAGSWCLCSTHSSLTQWMPSRCLVMSWSSPIALPPD